MDHNAIFPIPYGKLASKKSVQLFADGLGLRAGIAKDVGLNWYRSKTCESVAKNIHYAKARNLCFLCAYVVKT